MNNQQTLKRVTEMLDRNNAELNTIRDEKAKMIHDYDLRINLILEENKELTAMKKMTEDSIRREEQMQARLAELRANGAVASRKKKNIRAPEPESDTVAITDPEDSY